MKIKFIILGCGSSFGVPRADGYWGNCDPKEKKNYRTRCSALIKSKVKNILIDTSPDLRHQLIQNNITNIDVVIYSHKHGDQVHGINDLRVFAFKKNKKIPVFADHDTKKYLYNNFTYCFNDTPGYKAILKLIKNNPKTSSWHDVPDEKFKRVYQTQISKKRLGSLIIEDILPTENYPKIKYTNAFKQSGQQLDKTDGAALSSTLKVPFANLVLSDN